MTEYLVLFDVDGTLVDSQAVIVETMTQAFGKVGLDPPLRQDVLNLVGLSLPRMVSILTDGKPDETVNEVLAQYRLAFATAMEEGGEPPLYPGVAEGLTALAERGVQLGIATGKSKRGLDRVIAAYGWTDMFATTQCADFHPSKPHPSMVRRALLETGLEAEQCVVVGDTTYDLEMAQAAEVAAIGVTWGYHARPVLSALAPVAIVDQFEDLVTEIVERAG